MVNERKLKSLYNFFIVKPIIVSAWCAVLAFYLLCFIESRFTELSIFFSLFFFIMFFVLFFLKKKIHFIFAGLFIGSFAVLRLIFIYAEPVSLAESAKVEKISAELTGEASPAGEKYYAANAKILSVFYKNGAEFSAKGNIKIFFPAEMVLQNNAYSVSVYKSSGTNALSNFSKGVIFEASGRFGRKKSGMEPAAFFADKSLPEFLGWRSPLLKFRAFLRFYLMRLLSGWGSAGALLLALLSANRDFLILPVSSAFRNAGLSHVLALSGMHVSLVSLTAVQMGSIFGKKSVAVKFSLISIIIFVWFAGAAPSLNRALGMMLLIIIGKSLGLRPPMTSVLSAMLLVHIAVKPDEALSLGFMLSYGALAGILTFGNALFEILNGKIPPKILGAVSASVGAQAFTAPIVISKIGGIAPIGIIASVIISPLISVFLIMGIAAIFISLLFPFTGFIFSFLLNIVYDFIFILIQIFAQVPLMAAKSFGESLSFSLLPFAAGLVCVWYSEKILKKRELSLK
ncbi:MULTISPECIES: ComEC/Rec2 family competence protein [unclassified Treponema]|uniref:ComEC/Rec2 family competence protein n=1 Tax=unclassified Treponema TaxID=2638727 RepID=UPI0020A4CE97|nr:MULTISPECIES: ComEC/Rec2 family competence protein [unclassified Treponema]UTC67780.1 ComEC/Rec2 family competence protein [Treponema sp. OMZ 789]UTC70505.1 ComEC/Rec2 family competence protein [Treponema sp. OMZ 790]UTC73217.1 ComEC/Rec2 family competence protein [Treponema sp. OMZ 791]